MSHMIHKPSMFTSDILEEFLYSCFYPDISQLTVQFSFNLSKINGNHYSRTNFLSLVQANLIITLSLGSMKTDRIISEPCYNEVIYNRQVAK